MTDKLDEIMDECCKVCGLYKCDVHGGWVICAECPQQGKYDPKAHKKCPFCGKESPVAQ